MLIAIPPKYGEHYAGAAARKSRGMARVLAVLSWGVAGAWLQLVPSAVAIEGVEGGNGRGVALVPAPSVARELLRTRLARRFGRCRSASPVGETRGSGSSPAVATPNAAGGRACTDFLSAEQGTSFAGQFGHSALEHDREVVQRLVTELNRHRPPLRRRANCHVDQLQRGLLVQGELPVSSELANRAVDGFDCVGRVDSSLSSCHCGLAADTPFWRHVSFFRLCRARLAVWNGGRRGGRDGFQVADQAVIVAKGGRPDLEPRSATMNRSIGMIEGHGNLRRLPQQIVQRFLQRSRIAVHGQTPS